ATPTNHTTVTEAGHGLGDLTLKSFICAGGEVEIFSSSVCAEESMILPMDQPANSSTGDSDADLDIIKNDSHDDPLAEQNVTWKSFVCDGGEVEISDESRLKDETVPLPQSGQDEHQPDQSVDLSSLTDVPGHLSQEEHADHPYCITEISVSPVTANFTTLSETPQDKTPTGLSDITFKLFNCTGGEIEILDTTKHTDMTVPLPADQNATYNESDIPDVNPSFLAGDQDVQNRNDHSDHPYCASASTTSRGSLDVMYETEQNSFVHECQTDRDIGVAISTSTIAYVGTEQSNGNNLSEISPLPEGKREAYQPVDPLDSNAVSQGMTPEHTQDMCEKHNSVEIADAVVNEDPPTVTASLESLQNEFINCQDTPRKELMHPEDTTLPSLHQSFSAGMPTPVEVQQHVERSSTDVHPSGGPCVSVEAKDSALGSSSNGQGLCTSAEKPQAETLPDVLNVLSKCPSVVSALQFGLLSPAVRRASLAFLKAHGAPALDPFFIDDSALEGDKSMVAPVNVDPTGLLSEFMESSMPCPLFNSTAVGHTQPDPLTKPTDHLDVRSSAVPQSEVNKPSLDAPFIPGGPLQQQLRQMAEFLLLASGKMDPTAVSAPVPPPVATMVPSTRAESHNACVGTTPLKQDNHSVNTSGQFERKRDFTVEDECTLTDPLLWNVPPGSLECLPRQELEQRLHSSMIMVEVLVQQLAAARAHGCTPAGPAPSNLREKLVQTEHTELSQVRTHLDIYMTTCLERCNFMHTNHFIVSVQAFSAMDQLRTHCATEISELERSVGSQQQLLSALHQTYPEQFNQANLDLQAAREQIGDLNLQVTILTSEMGVLRQKLTEGEEERAQLERQVTELSATVSSTLASYTFLEQALAAETTKLQQSWKDIQQAKDRADELETSLSQSQQRVCELSQALAHSEQQMDQLQTLSQSQTTQIQQLQEVCTQLSGVREMNEFLQMENELAREQVAESESVLRANLQGLRERNIQCEDLKGELSQLQLENKSLQEELEIMRSKVSATESEHGENMAQAVTEITLLHHTLRGLTNDLHKQDKPKDPGQLVHNTERRHPSSSFVDSVMVALTAEKEEDVKTEPVCETLFSETSAFTRVATIAAKKTLNATEFEPEEQSSVAELLVDLGSTVTELASTLMSAQQHEDSWVCYVRQVTTKLFSPQDEKTVTKLVTEMSEIQEILNKYKTDNNELRKEALELRRALQQSQVESHFLREELKKAGGQSAKPAHFMEEKIELLKEVERLKMSLQEAEQARVKLLERAKRHVSTNVYSAPVHLTTHVIFLDNIKLCSSYCKPFPHVCVCHRFHDVYTFLQQIIHQTNQQKSEKELHMLSKVINKVREVRDAAYQNCFGAFTHLCSSVSDVVLFSVCRLCCLCRRL
uniref:Sperm associated antigen 5 n=1 Tax=Sphaeramia orbicularis TaxID=375764 RepID=A0A672YR48_9TELE